MHRIYFLVWTDSVRFPLNCIEDNKSITDKRGENSLLICKIEVPMRRRRGTITDKRGENSHLICKIEVPMRRRGETITDKRGHYIVLSVKGFLGDNP